MIFLKIALLNIKKHIKRCVLIMFTVMISVIVMEVASGMLDGIKYNAFNNLLQESGHMQIYSAGYTDRIDKWSIDKVVYIRNKSIDLWLDR